MVAVDWKNAGSLFINGDCMEYMKTMPDKCVELAITDPPYGKMPSRGGFGECERSFTVNDNKWDVKPDPAYFQELRRISANQIVWGFNHLCNNLGETNCVIVWDKDNDSSLMANCELAWTSFNTVVKIFRYTWNGMIQENMKDKEQRQHHTQKPIALYKWLLSNYAHAGDKILDTHVGSASSLIACHQLGFQYWGFELDAEYFKAASERLERAKAQVSMFNLAPSAVEQITL